MRCKNYLECGNRTSSPRSYECWRTAQLCGECYYKGNQHRHASLQQRIIKLQNTVNNHISRKASLGVDVKIWHGTYIGDDTKIGARTTIGSLTHIDYGVTIGRDCKIEGQAYLPPGTIVGNHVFIGPAAVITNDRRPDMTKDNYTLEGVIIDDYAVICARAVIRAGVRIGKGAMVGMGAVVLDDVHPNTTVVGIPAKPIITSKERKILYGH